MILAALSVIVLSVGPPQTAPGQAPAATGMIAGRLTSADQGRPVRKAQVKLTGVSPKLTRTTATDADGRFSFAQLPAGDYALAASKPGYLEMAFGARRPGAGVPGLSVSLAAGQQMANLDFRIPRGGVISGIVTDEFGDPAFGVPVRAIRFSFQNGHRTAQPIGNATTDDLGAYRIASLLPGEYAVSAAPRDSVQAAAASAESAALAMAMRQERLARDGKPSTPSADSGAPRAETPIARTGYVPTYYPAGVSPSTLSIVRLGVSQQVSGIDMQLQVLRTATISGIITGPDGAPALASVQLLDPSMPVSTLGAWFRHPGPDGRFSFAGMVPGTYVLRAQATKERGAAGDGSLTAEQQVIVAEGDDQEITVRLAPGHNVSGIVRLDTLPPATDLSKVSMQLLPISGPADWEMPMFRATPDADGRFSIDNVPAARYRVSAGGLPAGWSVDTAVFAGRDAADYNLDVRGRAVTDGAVTFAALSAQVTGTVSGSTGKPVSDLTVVLFPADRDKWVPQSRRIHVAQPGPDGRFTILALPAGDYRIAAIVPPEAGQQFDPEFLSQAAQGSISLTIAAGEQKTQDIRVR